MEILSSFLGQIAPFAIVGAIVSLLVQYVKQFFTAKGHALLFCIALSILAGIIVQFMSLVPTTWLTTIVNVFAAANTIYLAIVQWFEPSQPPSPAAPATSAPGI